MRAPTPRATARSRRPAIYIEDYHILQTTKEEGVMRAIRNGLHGAGIPVENSKGEWGPGQEEINVKYAEALDMADRHVILKNACKEIAWRSARPSPSWRSGTMGWPAIPRISISRLWSADGKSSLFHDPKARSRHVGR